jgi:hypothetical protein
MSMTPGLPWQPLFERLLAELEQPTSPDWQAPKTTVDPKVYYDAGRFQAERPAVSQAALVPSATSISSPSPAPCSGWTSAARRY